MGPKPMGIEIDQLIVVNISENLIGFVSFFDVVSDCGKMLWYFKSHGQMFPAIVAQLYLKLRIRLRTTISVLNNFSLCYKN
jgi:hypothetical protein